MKLAGDNNGNVTECSIIFYDILHGLSTGYCEPAGNGAARFPSGIPLDMSPTPQVLLGSQFAAPLKW